MAGSSPAATKGYTHEVEIEGGHTLVVDEPRRRAAAPTTGPRPTRLLAASLAACTAITIEMYADRKEWDLGDVEVEVEIDFTGAGAERLHGHPARCRRPSATSSRSGSW